MGRKRKEQKNSHIDGVKIPPSIHEYSKRKPTVRLYYYDVDDNTIIDTYEELCAYIPKTALNNGTVGYREIHQKSEYNIFYWHILALFSYAS